MTVKRPSAIILALLLGTIAGMLSGRIGASETIVFQTEEYLTIRWAGREHTHVIRPNGETESLGPLLSQLRRPDRVDERAYLMNIAINAAAREGYQVAAMTDDRVIMKRHLRP